MHGGTAPSWYFDEFAEVSIQRGRQVLRYDQYGRGWSDRPRIDQTPELYQRQLEQLLAHLGLTGPIDLLGYSFGGTMAARFAREHPDRVAHLNLIAPVVNLSSGAAIVAMAQSELFSEFFMATVGIRIIRKRGAKLIGEHPYRERWLAQFDEQTRYEGFQYSLRSTLAHALQVDYLPDYAAVAKERSAVLLAWGTDDAEIRAEHMRELRSLFDDIHYVELDSTHAVFSSQGVLLAEHVDQFCKRPR